MEILGNINLKGNELQNGRFEHLDDFPADPKVGTWSFIRKQLMLCVELEELPVWVPLTPERNTYLHEQQVAANEWIISHKLDQENVMVQCFDGSNSVMNPSSIEYVDTMTTRIVFPDAVLGKAIVMFGYTEGAHVDGKFKGADGRIEVGTIVRVARAHMLSGKCLPLMGQTVSATEYPELVEKWSNDPNATEIVLDDARGVFNRNLDFGKGKDIDRVEGSVQEAMVLRHGHTGRAASRDLGSKTTAKGGIHNHSDRVVEQNSGYGSRNSPSCGNNTTIGTMYTENAGEHAHSVYIGAHDHDVVVDENGGHENRPENIAYILAVVAK